MQEKLKLKKKKNFICKNQTNKGITLISIVISIIILLVLAGVSISTLTGDNGILTRANQAKKDTEVASDIEQINLLINKNQTKKYLIGDKLEEIKFNATENTKSIYDSETGETYADGWYFITPENSEKMKLYNSYIVNYETGKIIKYDENKHRILTNELKCITEGLVYVADPKNMTDGNNWGNAILHNFNEGDENSGWSENALMFDGIDDGIEVEDKSDYSNGITLEIYLKLRGQTENQLVQILMMKRKTVDDGFFMFIGNNNKDFEYKKLYIDIGGTANRFATEVLVEENEPIYITYTFNPNVENEKGILYINGEKRQTTNSGNIKNLIKIQNSFNIQIGSDIHETLGAGFRYPFNGEIYAARVYNRPLTQQEVKYNFDTTNE